jgi:hypothetical protein
MVAMTSSIQKELLQATDALKIVRLQIPAGGSLPEHPATVGGGKRAIQQGEVVVMPPKAPHAIVAESDLELVVVHARLQHEGEAPGCGA